MADPEGMSLLEAGADDTLSSPLPSGLGLRLGTPSDA
jgi:hypothetical protein